MKKINSVWFGGTFISIGMVFAAGIPLLLYSFSRFFGMKAWLVAAIRASIAIGAVIILSFAVLLAIELNQDKRINRSYLRKRNSRVELPDHSYECQNCGSRQVGKEDASCPSCGVSFNDSVP